MLKAFFCFLKIKIKKLVEILSAISQDLLHISQNFDIYENVIFVFQKLSK